MAPYCIPHFDIRILRPIFNWPSRCPPPTPFTLWSPSPSVQSHGKPCRAPTVSYDRALHPNTQRCRRNTQVAGEGNALSSNEHPNSFSLPDGLNDVPAVFMPSLCLSLSLSHTFSSTAHWAWLLLPWIPLFIPVMNQRKKKHTSFRSCYEMQPFINKSACQEWVLRLTLASPDLIHWRVSEKVKPQKSAYSE